MSLGEVAGRENSAPSHGESDDQFEAEVNSAARRLTRKLLGDGVSGPALDQLVATICTLAVGAVAAGNRVQPDKRALACQVGCTYCCYMYATASVPEILVILGHIITNLTEQELGALKARVAATDKITHNLDGYGRLLAGVPCPLLVDGKCSVYSVRPLVCRGYNSYNWAACADNSRRSRVWKDIPHNLVRRNSHSAALDGMLAGLGDVGLAGGSLELVAALQIVLNTPDVLERWQAGEDIFANAAEDRGIETEMKRSVNSRTYDTAQSEQIAEFPYGKAGEDDFQKETLYRDRNGEFFLAGVGGSDSYYAQLFDGEYAAGKDIIPLSLDEARRWLEDQQLTEVIEKLFGADQVEAGTTSVSVRLADATMMEAERAAARANVRLDKWIERLVNRELSESMADEQERH